MIGIFDSGVGGLTVLKHIHARLPDYSTMYLGDALHAPFGTKTHDEITKYTWEGVKWLFDNGCPLVILACNSASAQALRTIQQTKLSEYPDSRVLGVIRPTVEELAKKYKHVGIFATTATVTSEAYKNELNHLDPELVIHQHACPRWVEIVENGNADSKESEIVIEEDVQELLKKDSSLEAILLACTHYPVLFDQIRKVLPQNIDLYEQGPLVADSLEKYLSRHTKLDKRILKTKEHLYFTTGDVKQAQNAAAQIAGLHPEFTRVEITL